jgi:hypothetical protein
MRQQHSLIQDKKTDPNIGKASKASNEHDSAEKVVDQGSTQSSAGYKRTHVTESSINQSRDNQSSVVLYSRIVEPLGIQLSSSAAGSFFRRLQKTKVFMKWAQKARVLLRHLGSANDANVASNFDGRPGRFVGDRLARFLGRRSASCKPGSSYWSERGCLPHR